MKLASLLSRWFRKPLVADVVEDAQPNTGRVIDLPAPIPDLFARIDHLTQLLASEKRHSARLAKGLDECLTMLGRDRVQCGVLASKHGLPALSNVTNWRELADVVLATNRSLLRAHHDAARDESHIGQAS